MLVSAFLLVIGIIDTAPSLSFFLSSLPHISGAIIGVAIGSWIFALGLLKARTTWLDWRKQRARTSQTIEGSLAGARKALSKTTSVLIVVALVVIAAAGIYLVSSSSSQAPSGTSCATTMAQPSGAIISIAIPKGAASRSGAPGFVPDSVTLVIGVNSTVTWSNQDSAAHTVTSTSAPPCGSFNSGNLDSGQSWTHSFTVPGKYQYYCKYHSWMVGTIVVENASTS